MSEPRTPEGRSGEEPDLPRRPRGRELWETETEPFAGALVLADLETAAPDDAATILARFAAVRCMCAARNGARSADLERRAARAYVRAAPEPAARALRVLVRSRPLPAAALYRALRRAARHAVRRRHRGATYTFLRWAYEVARTAGQQRAAARTAAELARVAVCDGARYSAQRWSMRARALLADGAVSPRLAVRYVPPMEESAGRGGGAYDAAARRTIAARMARHEPLVCPTCGAPLSVTDVRPPNAVSYVRRRVWVLCTGCRRTAALDAPASGTS